MTNEQIINTWTDACLETVNEQERIVLMAREIERLVREECAEIARLKAVFITPLATAHDAAKEIEKAIREAK